MKFQEEAYVNILHHPPRGVRRARGPATQRGDRISKDVPITALIFVNGPIMHRALALTKVQEMSSAQTCVSGRALNIQ